MIPHEAFMPVVANSESAWRNAPGFQTGMRVYGGDERLHIEGDVLRLSVQRATRFVLWFGALFIPAFTAIGWIFVDDPTFRVIFGLLGPFAGIFTFGLIYALLRHHEQLGDYIVIDRGAGIVRLPRLKVEVPLAQVLHFQLIRGRSKSNNDVDTDLNLLVRHADDGAGGEPLPLRYHIMGQPRRRTLEQLAAFTGLTVEELDLGWRGYRDADVTGPGKG